VDNLSNAFAALCDPTRRGILDRLTRGPDSVNELADPFDMSQQAISKHLAYLERAKLIEKERRGPENICTLKIDVIREVAQWADGYRRLWESNFERLDTLLANMEKKERKNYGRKK
jgi:DNA-binding transcriptional ArsR family regulator